MNKVVFILALLLTFNLSEAQEKFFWSMNKVVGGVSTNGFRRSITVDNTKVSTTDQVDFPMVISGTYAYLADVAHGGVTASRRQIYFTSNSAGTSLVPFEIEKYDSTTGFITAHLKPVQLSHNTDSVLYMFYGATAATTDRSNRTGTWNSGYGAVWHMNEVITAASQTLYDATSNGLNLTSAGTWSSTQQATGQVGGSISLLNSGGDYLIFSGYLSSVYTLEGWFNISVADGTSLGFGLGSGGSSSNWFGSQYRLYNGFGDLIVDGLSTPINTWTHLAIVVNGANVDLYHNGTSSVATQTDGGGVNLNRLGTNNTIGNTSNIKYDEIRISGVARSAGWISTEYANQSSPSTFYTIGSQVAL